MPADVETVKAEGRRLWAESGPAFDWHDWVCRHADVLLAPAPKLTEEERGAPEEGHAVPEGWEVRFRHHWYCSCGDTWPASACPRRIPFLVPLDTPHEEGAEDGAMP